APHFDFAAACRYQQGPGWRRWKVSPVAITSVNKPSATPSQLDAARYVGYQFMLDTWATQGDEWMTTSLELLRDEHSGRWEGWFYLPRVVLMWAGSLLLTLALVAGFARLAMRNAYRARVEEVMGDVCPKCRYPRLGHNNELCPEC